ncbi:class I SAM-dependent methyltransferase [Brevundimonas sp. VNH65]|uniref:class I SAM-dependent methyltransferase n=1 Tax=Brevundimonas sp. VNH65 TaxID=3400917 RepID=UPI003C11EA3A
MTTNWFDAGGADYAAFRPDYPLELVDALSDLAPRRRLAIDMGCGAGQLTAALAERFDAVIGVDPSADQIAHARPHPGVRYVVAPAEATGLAPGQADLITAAQAAHWFDLEPFYDEARRLAAPGALLALITYGAPVLEPDLGARFNRFYADEIGPYWPAERRLVDSGYVDLGFPFEELTPPETAIRRDWALGDLLGYVGTWSAARRAREAGRAEVLEAFARDLAGLWGEPGLRRLVVWPVRMRLGRL